MPFGFRPDKLTVSGGQLHGKGRVGLAAERLSSGLDAIRLEGDAIIGTSGTRRERCKDYVRLGGTCELTKGSMRRADFRATGVGRRDPTFEELAEGPARISDFRLDRARGCFGNCMRVHCIRFIRSELREVGLKAPVIGNPLAAGYLEVCRGGMRRSDRRRLWSADGMRWRRFAEGIDARRHGDSTGWAEIFDVIPHIRRGLNLGEREAGSEVKWHST